jgi:uncharacterized protein (DUF1015 family)
MAEIRPFRALRYNTKVVGGLDRVVTQPYDKVSPEMQARYYDLSPYNLVRIIRGRQNPADSADDNVYTRAASHLRRWINEGVLTGDPEPGIYACDQEFAVPGSPEVFRKRRGFIALGRVEDYSAGVVHRHEETLSGPKADRLELLKATRAHCEQLFMLYSDPAGEIEQAIQHAAANLPPQIVTDEYGGKHSLWRLSEPETVSFITSAMRQRKLVIADGHHRYETAVAYRDYCRSEGRTDDRAEFVMMTFIRKENEGLLILPTHRAVHSLPSFEWSSFLSAAQQYFHGERIQAPGASAEGRRGFTSALAEAGRRTPALGVYAGRDKLALLRMRSELDLAAALPDLPAGLRQLDVVILHRLLIEQVLGIDRRAVREEKNLHYVREWDEALRQVDEGKAQVSFLMNPTPIAGVWDNALAGHPLPQKSTDFYPKLLSGLTMYWLDNPAGM